MESVNSEQTDANLPAGMSVHAPHERTALLDLIETFQRRVRWPVDSLRNELEAEYQKDELSAFAG